MKTRMLAAIAVCAFGFGSANAAEIVHDNFNYADGALVPNGGWASHSGNLGTLLVSSGQAVIQMNGSASEDANLAFAPVAGMIYYGIDFSVTADSVSGGDYEYFAHFKDSGFGFAGRLDVVEALGGGDYSVGIASDESTADTIWPTDLVFGTTYRAVVRYDQAQNIAELWIDATLPGDQSILGEDRADPGDTIESFALRQSFSSSAEVVVTDNLCVGTTFADVVTPCTDTVAVEEKTWSGVKSLYDVQ